MANESNPDDDGEALRRWMRVTMSETSVTFDCDLIRAPQNANAE